MKYRWVQNGKVISEGTLVPGSHEEHLESLVRRAAELLRWPATYLEANDSMPNKYWFEQRDQWLKDAGMEK